MPSLLRAACLMTLLALPLRAAAPVDFAREVRPLLLKHCLTCHDAGHAKGGLRLDSREAALKGGKSKQSTLVPGSPAKSELVRRITPAHGVAELGHIAMLDTGWPARKANFERWLADEGRSSLSELNRTAP